MRAELAKRMRKGKFVRHRWLLVIVFLTGLTMGGIAEGVDATRPGAGEATMRIRITAGETVLTATMLDDATARDFLALMPVTLTLRDYAGTEKVGDLPRKLSTEGAPPGIDPAVGDLAFYAPWGNLAIFYRDFGYSGGLILLGRVDGGAEHLSRLEGKVTFEPVK